MRFPPVLTLVFVITLAFVALPNAVNAEAEAEAGAETLAEADLPENAELKKPKPKGTTTMSPRDLFLMHAQQSTTKHGSKNHKVGSTLGTTTTSAIPATMTTTTTTTTITTTSEKPKSKPSAKPKCKGKGKDKACRTNQKSSRKSRADCHHSHHNKTVVHHTEKRTTNETGISIADPVDPAVTTGVTTSPAVNTAMEGDVTLTTAALIPERSDKLVLEMAASEPLSDTVPLDSPNVTSTSLVDDTLKEIRTKAELIALDSVNGTIDDLNIFP